MLQCSRFQNVRSRLPPSSEHFSIYGLAARSQGDAAQLSLGWAMKGGAGGVSLALEECFWSPVRLQDPPEEGIGSKSSQESAPGLRG